MSRFLFVNAELYDGSGAPPERADVAVSGERIEAVEPAGTIPGSGYSVIEADGLTLTPGFIDVHGHSDTDILGFPEAENKISQGITTEIAGNCGFSDFADMDGGFSQYARTVEAVRPALNLAVLAGHNTIRSAVMGQDARPANRHETEQMKQIVAQALEQGAAGFSSGLWYSPGIFAETEEVAAIADSLRGTGKPYATHIRSEGDTLLESLREACVIARAGDGILQVSHFKTWGSTNWHKLDDALRLIRRERENGLRIAMDRYPYLYAGTGLRMCLPAPWSAMTPEQIHPLLRDRPEERDRVLSALRRSGPNGCSWDRIILAGSSCPSHKPYLGCTMSVIAKRMGAADEAEACVRLLQEEFNPFAMSGLLCMENLEKILKQDCVMPGSDAGLQPRKENSGHPRKFGTMPRFFHLVSRLVSPQEAVRRMTVLPAETFHLSGRGLVRAGYAADLVLFKKETFTAEEDVSHPVQPLPALRAVYVNGAEAWSAQAGPGERNGRFLRIDNPS